MSIATQCDTTANCEPGQYQRSWCPLRQSARMTCVSLKRSDVFTLNTSAFLGSFARSTVIGPTCRHASAKRDLSSATPTVPFMPPVRACERWHVTPGTWGSSKALTQILSLAPRRRNVVDTQPISSACRRPTALPSSTTKSIQPQLCLTIPSPPQPPLIARPPHCCARLRIYLRHLKLRVRVGLLRACASSAVRLPTRAAPPSPHTAPGQR